MDELWQRMKVTVPLSLVSVLLAYLLALPLGILSAVKQGSLADKATTFVLFLLYSIPTFWAGLMLILAFGATGLEWLPVIGLHDKDAEQLQGWDYAWDLVRHCILPVATLTYGGLAYLSRQMRVGMLETVRQDFIRTARAKGLSEKVVVFRHALRNSLIPVVTVFATILPILIGGSVIVETVFNIPGMGLYAFQGLITRDYNIVMATVTVSSIMTLLGFLLSDVLYAVVDPRISYD
jgi:peptide/nickel transport system permease protein